MTSHYIKQLRRTAASCPVLLAGSLATAATSAPNAMDTLAAPAPVALPLLRVAGALALVLAIFLGGSWIFRNGRKFLARPGAAPKLNVLEFRSLGHRQAIYVVGYERQRMLLATSPTGVAMLTHLPPDESAADSPPQDPSQPVFSATLLQAVTHRP